MLMDGVLATCMGFREDDGLLVSVDMPMPNEEDHQMIGVAVKKNI